MKYYTVTRQVVPEDGEPHPPAGVSPAFDTKAEALDWLAKKTDSSEFKVTEVEKFTYGVFDEQMGELASWSYEQAAAAQEQWQKDNKSGASPMMQWTVLSNHLPECKKGWKNKDSKALMNAIALCGAAGLPVPRWVTSAMYEATSRINQYQESSWDVVLGQPHKGAKVSLLKAQKGKRIPAVLEVFRLVEQDPPTPTGKAIEQVAADHAISTKRLEGWYYEWQ